MSQKSLLSKLQKQYISKIVIAVFLALFIIAGALLMAGGLLRVLGAGKTRDQIHVVDKTTEKIAMVPDQKIQNQIQKEQAAAGTSQMPEEDPESEDEGGEADQPAGPYVFAEEDENTAAVTGKYTSTAMIMIDLDTGKIVAQKNPDKKILPTALTKVMTALVAVENLNEEQMQQTIIMSEEAKTFCKEHGLSKTDIKVGAEVSVMDLLYGTIVPAGADACYELANVVAGSQEAFADLMNKKARELELSETTNFTNPAGDNAKGHTSTVKDLAIIMKAATENQVLGPILEAREYTASTGGENGGDVTFTSKFYQKLEAYKAPGNIVSAKSGYTEDSGGCGMTLCESPSGKRYICVTAGGQSAVVCAAEQATFLKKYTD